MDKSKTPKQKTHDRTVHRRPKKEQSGPVPLEDDLEQIRRELGWGLVKHKKQPAEKK